MANQVQYGFRNLQHLWDRRVTDVGVTQVAESIDATLAEHNRQLNALLSIFVTPTNERSRQYKQGGARRLQPGTEESRPIPTLSGLTYDVGFPLQRGQDALGFTYEASQTATVSEVNQAVADMRQGDIRWMRDHILAALLDNTSWSFSGDEQAAVTVQPMANADTVTYLLAAGGDAGATEDHYVAQVAAIADATNPYDDLRDDLLEHPENTGEDVIAFIPSGLVATTRLLANFYPEADDNITLGSGESRLARTLGIETPGRLIGYVDGVWVVEWRYMPANTILGVATGGERPLAMRELPNLPGFRRDAERNNYPWYSEIYTRRAGFGGNNRVGAAVYQVSGGDTTYDIPTNFSTPMW
jgi:hypothetical protein